jgi:prevent-host-death family protein
MCYIDPMTRIGVRELRQHASRYLDRVKSGETIEVTVRGELVAVLAPPSSSKGARDRLIATGRLVPARSAFVLPPLRRSPRSKKTASEILSESRDES